MKRNKLHIAWNGILWRHAMSNMMRFNKTKCSALFYVALTDDNRTIVKLLFQSYKSDLNTGIYFFPNNETKWNCCWSTSPKWKWNERLLNNAVINFVLSRFNSKNVTLNWLTKQNHHNICGNFFLFRRTRNDNFNGKKRNMKTKKKEMKKKYITDY